MTPRSDGSVFIGMPVYNAQAGLATALTSLLTQQYSDLHILISDNGSTDATFEIASTFASRDPRITLTRSETNNGPTWNFNKVLNASAGYPFFMWAAHDDHWSPDYVAVCVEGLRKDPTLVLCGTHAGFVDVLGEPTGEVDTGVTTVGLPATNRALRYLETVVRNSIFYGVYRRDLLGARRIPNCIGGDHLFLFDACLAGAIRTLPRALLTRRTGSTSRTAAAIYASLGIRRRWAPKLFRLDVYRRLLQMVAGSVSLDSRTRRTLLRGIIRVGIRRHVVPNLRPRRLLWWLRHGGTSQPRPNSRDRA